MSRGTSLKPILRFPPWKDRFLPGRPFRNAGRLAAAVLVSLAVSLPAFAANLPAEPRTLAGFEAVWDYAAASGAEQVRIHYSERQSVNTYQKYKNILPLMTEKYRYVHPEDFNYLHLERCSFVEDEGGQCGFTMVLDFADLNSRVKRTYRAAAAEKAEELYRELSGSLSPDMSQRERAKVLCGAVADRVRYKNDGTDLCHTAYCALVNGYAVCDGYTSLLNMLLRLDGIECEGRVGNTEEGLHSWSYAKLDGEWVNVDATWYDALRLEYAGLTDAEIAGTHTVDLSYQELVEKEREKN